MSDSSECKKAKGVNKNVFAKISHSEYEDVNFQSNQDSFWSNLKNFQFSV